MGGGGDSCDISPVIYTQICTLVLLAWAACHQSPNSDLYSACHDDDLSPLHFTHLHILFPKLFLRAHI